MDEKNIDFDSLLNILNNEIKENSSDLVQQSMFDEKETGDTVKDNTIVVEPKQSDTVTDNTIVIEPKQSDTVTDDTIVVEPVARRQNRRFSTDHRERISGTFDKLKKRDVYSDGDSEHKEQFSQLREPTEQEKKGHFETDNTVVFKVDKNETVNDDIVLENALGIRNEKSESEENFEKKFSDREKFSDKLKKNFKAFKTNAKDKLPKPVKVEPYTSVEQNKKFLSMFRKQSNSVSAKLILTALFTFMLIYADLVPVVGIKLLPSFMMPPTYNVVYVLFQMQLLFFIILINNRALSDGFLSILDKRPNPNSVTLIFTAAVIIHDIVTLFVCTKDINVCVYNSVCAISFIAGLSFEYLNIKTRLSQFKIASGKNRKYVISKIPKQSSEEAVFSDYADELHGGMYCVSKTKFTTGLMEKIHSINKVEGILRFLIPVAIAISAVFFIIAIRLGGYEGYHAFTLSLMMSLPIAIFVSSSYPSARTQSMLEPYGTAILGAESSDTLSDAGVMSFNDSDVFPATGIKVNNIYIYGNYRIDHVIYYAAGAFNVLGGPLKTVFGNADDGVGMCSDVKMTQIADNGFTMLADGKEIIVGKSTYLRSKGYLTESSEADASYESKNGRIMYMAYDGNIAAKFFIKYTMDPEFDLLLKKADSIGIFVGVRTYDPNIDDGLLAQNLNLKKYPVKVVKLTAFDSLSEDSESIDCPAVSRGSKGGAKALLNSMMLSSKMSKLRLVHTIASFIAIGVSAVIMALLIHSGTFTSTYALYPILFQILWTVFSACITNISLQ